MDSVSVDLDALRASSKLPEHAGFSKLVHDAIVKRLGWHYGGIQQICDDIRYTRSTIFRRLRAEGTHFTEIRNKIVFHKTITMVLDTNLSIKDISLSLGFRQVQSFTKYVVAQCGVPPTVLRHIHAQGLTKVLITRDPTKYPICRYGEGYTYEGF